LAITFAEADYPLVLMLQLLIGGSIRHKIDDQAYVLTITSINGLVSIINLINGKLRTPKLGKFNDMIRWINNTTGSTFATHTVDKSSILSNAWLSGFVDADGSFDIRISLISNGAVKDRIAARLRLEQRMIDPYSGESYFDILTLIADGLGITLATSKHNGGVSYYLMSATSTKARVIVANYFALFPLFSSKHLNYLDWLACHNMMVSKRHTTEAGRSEALFMKSRMNSKRTFFNWDHLEALKSY
jgi:hypothetical protein